jgi:hypothetical protein
MAVLLQPDRPSCAAFFCLAGAAADLVCAYDLAEDLRKTVTDRLAGHPATEPVAAAREVSARFCADASTPPARRIDNRHAKRVIINVLCLHARCGHGAAKTGGTLVGWEKSS